MEITYQFEIVQRLKFAVYDIDNETPSLSDDDYLGGMECTLAEVRKGERWGGGSEAREDRLGMATK